ncbi:ABC-type dipeptide/oligopeptide/nickel transport system, ATPase component [Hahella chejuensis KCTC 2396]|uniref:ABC-type dipeptide transporter n=1 Tax=Hahella chejuensis (strain KCTC 2396) TaxID=349521 RepID=Q2SL04_HAHCH|nr:ABC transporter ATP-binding protein [Hahella chejuensis]ABC28670.1 ABC-type dipeptide/oligopeptide/nickel transport system, ATPase component [Hahella chejuensis KCTC 2396]
MALLEVKNLEVKFGLRSGAVTALRDISFTVDRGQRLGIVGESGAGKSVAAFSILNLLSRPGYISSGEINFDGKNLLKMSPDQLRNVRGNRISMIFQDPMMTLNPVLTVGAQMVECLQAHTRVSKEEARKIALEKLKLVQIPSPEKRLDQYPHELSGGMKQRIIIAIALLLNPDIIIADEPTTALDVTIQAEIMDLLLELCKGQNLGLILITHDLGVVSQVTQQMIVMYAGKIIEQGPTKEIINDAQHPYTQGLINALPQQGVPGERLYQIPGAMPPLQRIPKGCAFHPRCAYAQERCEKEQPDFTISGGCRVACHMVEDMIKQANVPASEEK